MKPGGFQAMDGFTGFDLCSPAAGVVAEVAQGLHDVRPVVQLLRIVQRPARVGVPLLPVVAGPSCIRKQTSETGFPLNTFTG